MTARDAIPALFDAPAAVRTLETAGIERQRAEAHAETLRASRAGLATQAGMETALASMEARLMAHIRAEYWRLFAAILASNLGIGAIFLAAAKFLWP